MPEPSTFDDYSRSYSATVQSALGASGERHSYFVELKATLTRAALSGLRPARILDFGCGVGLSTHALRDAFPGAEIVGVDDSAESVAVARDGAAGDPRLRFEHSAGERLPFDDATFDVVFTACVFHRIEPRARRAWAAELARVTRPGGAVIVFEHNPWNPLTVRVVRRVPFDAGVVLLRGAETRSLLAGARLATAPPRYYFFFPRPLARLRPAERWMRWLPIGAQYYVTGRKA